MPVRKAPNKIDRTNIRYGKLVALRLDRTMRWFCLCDCGNTVSVLSTNLSGYARNNRGCKHCANRQDITGEKRGMLTAVSVEAGPLKGRHPLWTFNCDCGGTIQGRVAEFRIGWIRSCGCHDSTWGSWSSMMGRCYDPKNLRYNSYGGRGITVCEQWHTFENFADDMKERPKRHNLGRKRAEEGYSLDNCMWEHVSKNCRDTNNDGTPTKPGLLKGAKNRKKKTP